MGFQRHLATLGAAAALAGCGGTTRPPERCRNLVVNPGWEKNAAGWNLPPFARLDGSVAVVEGAAEGALSQQIPRTDALAGVAVVTVGYARVRSSEPVAAGDEDVTPRLWQGTVNVVNGFSKNGRDFYGPYARLRFTGREVASGAWKRFVTEALPAGSVKILYPHFAFWGARLAPGVRLEISSLSLVEAAAADGSEPESWVSCPALPAPAPCLESATRHQWEMGLPPDGSFDETFALSVRPVSGGAELRLRARYRQGARVADRFLVALTEDGSDPRLSPTSRVLVVPARRGVEEWEATATVGRDGRRVAMAVAAAAATEVGLRAQTPLLPAPWQRPAL